MMLTACYIAANFGEKATIIRNMLATEVNYLLCSHDATKTIKNLEIFTIIDKFQRISAKYWSYHRS